ncbi:MAG: TRAP transporter substrate-binding protein [Treponema sp.]|nr:TRAP transporter substrate-binding protein [Treponema sp.]
MIKRSILFSSVMIFSILAISCKSKKDSIEAQKEITLVMAEVNPPETIAGRTDQAFKEKVEELSGGKIKIDLQCSGILGDNSTVRKLITQPNSTIHIARQSTAGFVALGCNKYALLSIPFTFSNREHFWRFASSETAKKLLDEPREKGLNIVGLYYGEEGFRHLFSTKRIDSIKDLAGLTMRVTNDMALQAIADNLKMNQKQVNFADLYGALSTGQVDVADQPLANYLANHFNEVAPYIILDSHQLGIMETFITTECWDALSQIQQDILREAGAYASEYCRKISQEEEDKILEQIKAAGVTVVDVADIAPWQDALSTFIAESSAGDMELYKEILSYAKK